jgi:hypothetical protein
MAQSNEQAIGYWLLIVGGIASLAWIHFGDKIRSLLPTSADREHGAPATRKDIVKLAHAIAENSDFANELANLTKEIIMKEMQIVLLRDVTPKLDSAAKHIDDIRLQIDHNNRDLRILLYHALYDLNLRTLRDLLTAAPKLEPYFRQEDLTAEWLNNQRNIADKFVTQASKALRYTPRYERLLAVIANAENKADQEVREIPRPEGVDPYDLQSYIKAVLKCVDVRSFLSQEEKEMVQNTQAQREAIQERFSLKNP